MCTFTKIYYNTILYADIEEKDRIQKYIYRDIFYTTKNIYILYILYKIKVINILILYHFY